MGESQADRAAERVQQLEQDLANAKVEFGLLSPEWQEANKRLLSGINDLAELRGEMFLRAVPLRYRPDPNVLELLLVEGPPRVCTFSPGTKIRIAGR